jgi:hypothetical protein
MNDKPDDPAAAHSAAPYPLVEQLRPHLRRRLVAITGELRDDRAVNSIMVRALQISHGGLMTPAQKAAAVRKRRAAAAKAAETKKRRAAGTKAASARKRRATGRKAGERRKHGAVAKQPVSANEQAVLVYLDGKGLSDEVYKQYDVAGLEDQLVEAIEQAGVGEYDGDEFGPGEVTLFMYGPDAEALYRVVEPVLREYPLSQNARVLIRPGGPEVAGRVVRLGQG